MTGRFSPWGFLFFLLPAFPARGGEAVLSWADCVALARRQNPDLAGARKTLEAERARHRGSRNALWPGVTLFNSVADADAGGRDDRWQAGGNVEWRLVDPGDWAAVSAAAAARARAAADLRLRSAQVRYELRKAFATLWTGQQQVRVAGQIRDIRRSNAQMVALKYESGRESKGNRLKAQAEAWQAEAALAQASRDLRAGRQALARRLGEDVFTVLAVTGPLTAAAPTAPPDTAALSEDHPQIQSFRAAEALARANLATANSGLWPSLSAAYARSFTGPDEFPSSPHWNLSGTLRWTLFGGRPTAAVFAVSAARRDLEKAAQDLRAARQQVWADLESAWADWAAAVDRIEVQRRFLEAARQRNDEASVRYSSGLMSFEDWELVVSDLVNFEQGVLQAERDAVIAQANWERVVGKGLEAS